MPTRTQSYITPTCIEAERSVLGAILLDNECYFQAAASIRPDYFLLDSHRRIYAAMLELDVDGKPFDYVTLTEKLVARKELDAIGGVAYLASLTDGFPRVSNIRHYVDLIREKARLRQIIHTCDATINRAASPDAVPAECEDDLEEALLRIRSQDASGSVQHVSEFAEESYQQLMKLSESADELIGYSTGIETVDSKTTGIRKHQLWMVGGRTGEGKSCIASQIIVANACKGVPVLLFTPEMSREQVLERLWVQVSGVPAWKFTKPQLMGRTDRELVRNAKDQVFRWPLLVDDSSSISAQEISARARLHAKQDGVQLVVVDYVQLIEARGKDERERVSAVSRCLRSVAKDIAPVVALSQMPRPKDDLNRWPTKYDLKESGSLENDASTILMIFRKVDEKSLPTGEDFIVIPKQRHGPTGFAPVTFDDDRLLYKPRTVETL